MKTDHVKLSTRFAPPLREVADRITELLSVRDAELVSEVCREYDGGRLILLVYRMYFLRIKDDAALTVLLMEEKGETTADLIPAGGGAFGDDWGAGAAFGKLVESALRTMGFLGEKDDVSAEDRADGLLTAVQNWWRKE